MKDSKFIELLNLYVDRQISAADAALLETEIQQSSARRQVYRQYCQMQKACVTLADKFRTEAPAGRHVAGFTPPRRRLAPLAYATGLVAAAACVALVLVNRSRFDGPAASPSKGNAAVAMTETVRPATVSPVRLAETNLAVLQPVFKGPARDGSPVDIAFDTADRAPLDWMSRVQFDRVPAVELRFDHEQSAPADSLVFRSRRVFQTRPEDTAFRFQK